MTREEIIESLENIKYINAYHRCREGIAIDKAIELLKEPEQKKGQWEEIRNAYGEIEGWTCTCGREVKCKYNYCPNCGADMRGEHG